MPAFINTNIASLNAQRNLNTSQSSLTTSLQRLSSGLRINSAKDDAAGLAIATRFTSQINGTNQAIRNANDGISLAQTAEGSLNEITNNLQRIRELALQSANSTNSDSDREALDQEVQQRLAEIDRNASQTNFNGQKILDGSLNNVNFQIGANAGETIGINLGSGTSMRTASIGKIATATSGTAVGQSTGGSAVMTAKSLMFGTAGQVGSVGTNTVTFATGNYTNVAASGGKLALTGVTGFDASGGNDVHVDVDGLGATLTGDYSAGDAAAFTQMATDLTSALNASAGSTAYAVTSSGAGNLTITKTATGASSTAPAISFGDAAATTAGLAAGAGTPTGGADITENQMKFTVDDGVSGNKKNVTLSGNYSTVDQAITDLAGQLGSGYTVTNAGGKIKIDSTTVGSAGVAIGVDSAATSAEQANAATAGFGASAGTAGNAAISSTNASFTVGGVTDAVNLNQNYATSTALASAIQSQLDAADSGAHNGQFKVTADHEKISITRTDTSDQSNVVVTGDTNAAAAGFNSAGTSGVAGGTAVHLTNLKIQGVDITGDFDDANKLADKINKNVTGVYASVDSNNKLVLSSSSKITMSGSDATTALGFASTSADATNGSLDSISTKTVDSALSTLQRVDSALNAVNGLRSTFGAIQNRFESVISNLSSTTENLAAARSRIQDADFAQETANLTRGQILQQAGTAMLAQANGLPNGVLALLRG